MTTKKHYLFYTAGNGTYELAVIVIAFTEDMQCKTKPNPSGGEQTIPILPMEHLATVSFQEEETIFSESVALVK